MMKISGNEIPIGEDGELRIGDAVLKTDGEKFTLGANGSEIELDGNNISADGVSVSSLNLGGNSIEVDSQGTVSTAENATAVSESIETDIDPVTENVADTINELFLSLMEREFQFGLTSLEYKAGSLYTFSELDAEGLGVDVLRSNRDYATIDTNVSFNREPVIKYESSEYKNQVSESVASGTRVDITPDGSRIILGGGYDITIVDSSTYDIVWNWNTDVGDFNSTFDDGLETFAVSPDGNHIALCDGGYNNGTRIGLLTNTGTDQWTFTDYGIPFSYDKGTPEIISWNDDGTKFAIAAQEWIAVYDTNQNQLDAETHTDKYKYRGLEWLGDSIYTTRDGNGVMELDPASLGTTRSTSSEPQRIEAHLTADDSNQYLFGPGDNSEVIYVYNIESELEFIGSIRTKKDDLKHVNISPDGTMLGAAGRGSRLLYLNQSDPLSTRVLYDFSDNVWGDQFSTAGFQYKDNSEIYVSYTYDQQTSGLYKITAERKESKSATFQEETLGFSPDTVVLSLDADVPGDASVTISLEDENGNVETLTKADTSTEHQVNFTGNKVTPSLSLSISSNNIPPKVYGWSLYFD